MTTPSSSFHLGDVITGEPHLYRDIRSLPDVACRQGEAARAAQPSFLTEFIATARQILSTAPRPQQALAPGAPEHPRKRL